MRTDIHTLAGAYVLDAVSDIERAEFGRHLAGCESCAMEVAELREGAARLADATWSVPPPRLRENVLTQVSRTRQVRPGRADRDGPSGMVRWRRRTAAAVAAGILVTGAGAAVWAVQEQRVRDERMAAAAAREQAARIQAVLAAPDARLRTGPVAGGGRVSVVLSAALDEGVVVMSGVPAPGADRAYQLWNVEGGVATSLGVLAAGQTEATRLVVGVRGMDALGVSVEPAGGSPRPTAPVAAAIPMA